LWRLQNSYFYIRFNFLVSNAGTPAGSTTVDYLVVAGGGGGGVGSGGGAGGAGGFRESSGNPAAPYTASPLDLVQLHYQLQQHSLSNYSRWRWNCCSFNIYTFSNWNWIKFSIFNYYISRRRWWRFRKCF
jgi:hypothetical protein